MDSSYALVGHCNVFCRLNGEIEIDQWKMTIKQSYDV